MRLPFYQESSASGIFVLPRVTLGLEYSIPTSDVEMLDATDDSGIELVGFG